jgi:hypothetical protein
MYSLEQLQQNNIKQLKEIGLQLNVLPEGDRRCRQSWIDALVNVNPPLLQLLEASPAASVVEQVQPIIQTVETPPAVEVEPVQTPPIESKFCRIVYPRPVQKPIAQAVENFPGVDPGVDLDRVQEPIAQVAKNSPGGEVDRVSEPKSIAHELLQLFKSSVRIEEPITETVKNSPCVEVDPVQEPIDVQRHEAIELQAQDSIKQAVENSLDVEFSGFERVTQSNRNNFSGFERVTQSNRNNFSGFEHVTQSNRNNFSGFERFQEPEQSDRHLILTGLTFSDRFLARYAPPQAQIIYFQSDADGQLSLLDFEVQSVDEPPDPDDFESLDAFREALARWDCEHNEVSPEHNQPLQVSLDSFSLWGLCPADWYESVALLEPSSMLELSQTCKSSITSDFFIPTFDCLSDRSNKSDEPPDTGVFAKLPKPKPPSFSPATVGQVRAKRSSNAAQTQSKRIPNAYQTHTCCILAGSSTQPARSPPGGDAGF